MFIVSQNKEIVVNADKITNIMISGSRIVARMVDSEEVIIGEYKERVGSALEETLNALLIQNTYRPVYYMPEE